MPDASRLRWGGAPSGSSWRPEITSSASLRLKPPTNIARRRSNCCSSGDRRSWVQSNVALSVWWRGAATVALPPSTLRLRCSRPRSSSSPSTGTRAAASSMASGSPSRRRQISATAGALAEVRRNCGDSAVARAANRVTAPSWSGSDRSRCVGADRPASGKRCSCASRSAWRLVTSRRSCEVLSSSPPTAAEIDSHKCSALSITTSIRRAPSAVANSCNAGRCAARLTPSAWAIAPTTWAGSITGAMSTNHTPAGHRGCSACATASARLVLPTPPTPSSVTRRFVSSRARTAATSSVRP